jgi:hypothetical protein
MENCSNRLNETFGFFVAFSLLKKENNFFTNFWHSGDKSDFLPILQKMHNTNVSFDRVYQSTSKALGVSYTSVHRIMNDKRPCKSNRPKERAKIRG